MAWAKEQKGLQREKFKQWRAKNTTNHKSGFRAPKHAAGKGAYSAEADRCDVASSNNRIRREV